jgi:hypothetical protein
LGGTLEKFDNAALAIADELAMKYDSISEFRDAIIAAYEKVPACQVKNERKAAISYKDFICESIDACRTYYGPKIWTDPRYLMYYDEGHRNRSVT